MGGGRFRQHLKAFKKARRTTYRPNRCRTAIGRSLGCHRKHSGRRDWGTALVKERRRPRVSLEPPPRDAEENANYESERCNARCTARQSAVRVTPLHSRKDRPKRRVDAVVPSQCTHNDTYKG